MKEPENSRSGRASAYKRVSCASLTAMESMRFPSLRVVNNGDGDDNEAIYGHALAHVLASMSVAAI